MTTTTPPITRAEREEHKESAHRKRIQAQLSTAGGLIGGGAFAGLAASKALPKIGKIVPTKNPAKFENAARKMGKGAIEAGTVGGGVGALSSLNFANVSRKEAQKEEQIAGIKPKGIGPKDKMNNTYALKKSLSDIAKGQSVAVPEGSPAWKMAGNRKDQRWRLHVSDTAQQRYGDALAPSRQKAAQSRAAGHTAAAGGAGVSLASLAAGHKHKNMRTAIPLAAISAGAGAAGEIAGQKRSRSYDMPSRKMRARGFQRMLDQDIGKAFGIKSPGSYTKGTLARTGTGKMVLRNSYLTPTKRRR